MRKLITCLNTAALTCALAGTLSRDVAASPEGDVLVPDINAAVLECSEGTTGERIDVPGFGTFSVRHRGARYCTCIGTLDTTLPLITDEVVVRLTLEGFDWTVVITPVGSSGLDLHTRVPVTIQGVENPD
jgi:hypothetical protein